MFLRQCLINLKTGENVRLYYIINEKIKVSNVGDSTGLNKNRVFSVSQNTIDKELYNALLNSKNADGEYEIDLFF